MKKILLIICLVFCVFFINLNVLASDTSKVLCTYNNGEFLLVKYNDTYKYSLDNNFYDLPSGDSITITNELNANTCPNYIYRYYEAWFSGETTIIRPYETNCENVDSGSGLNFCYYLSVNHFESESSSSGSVDANGDEVICNYYIDGKTSDSGLSLSIVKRSNNDYELKYDGKYYKENNDVISNYLSNNNKCPNYIAYYSRNGIQTFTAYNSKNNDCVSQTIDSGGIMGTVTTKKCYAVKEQYEKDVEQRIEENINYTDIWSPDLGKGDCSAVEKIANDVNNYILIPLRYIVPIIFLIMTIIDFAKSVFVSEKSSDGKDISKAKNNLLRRVIISVIVYFIPNIVLMLFNLFGLVCEQPAAMILKSFLMLR